MNRESEAVILDFCVQQHAVFEPEAWLEPATINRDELAAAALFLSGVEWFGHRRELLDVAGRLHRGCAGRFSELARLTQFDCARFSNSLRRRLDRAHTPS